MADPKKRIGYSNPPRHTQFPVGKSGNPKGRPKGSKNFATVIERELNDRVPVTENGKRKKISKREAIAKQVINKAAGGDLKAAQTVFNQTRFNEDNPGATNDLGVFDSAEDRLVMGDIIRRIRSMDPSSPETAPEQRML
ncbi:MAG: DUF5681 domain-containing protein, partial [Candidatus Sulfotelmatobacter sp.]